MLVNRSYNFLLLQIRFLINNDLLYKKFETYFLFLETSDKLSPIKSIGSDFIPEDLINGYVLTVLFNVGLPITEQKLEFALPIPIQNYFL